MASVRRRTWNTKAGPKSAWVVSYMHAGKQHHKTFSKKKMADAWRAEMQTEQKKGIHTPASTSITIADAAARWLEQAQNDGLEPSTLASYEQFIRLHIEPFIGVVRLVDLTAAGVEDFRNRLRREGRSSVMVSKTVTALAASSITQCRSVLPAATRYVKQCSMASAGKGSPRAIQRGWKSGSTYLPKMSFASSWRTPLSAGGL